MRPGAGSIRECCERLSEETKRVWTADEYKRKLFNDFLFFKSELWFDRGLDLVAPLSEVELEIAQWACYGPRLRQIIGFRGIGKTYDAATLAAYRGRRDRNRRMAVYAKSLDKVKETAALIRAWLDAVWFLKDLAPTRDSRDKVIAFDFAGAKEDRAHSVSVLGIGGMLEGGRAHSIIPDDIETKSNTTTLEARESLARITAEFVNILYPDIPHERGGPIDPTEIVVLGTYKHEESVYLKLEKRGYVIRSFPLVYPSPNDKVRGLAACLAGNLATNPALADTPTVPLRFPESEVAIRRASGRLEFSLEFKLICDLALSDRYPLKLADLIVMPLHRDKGPISVAWGQNDHNGSTALSDPPCLGFDSDRLYRPIAVDPQWEPYNGTKCWFDPSGRGADRNAGAAVAMLNGYLFWKGRLSLKGGSSTDEMAQMVLFARQHNCREIYIESNADTLDTYRQLFEPVLRSHFLEPGEDPLFPQGWKATLIMGGDDSAITHSTGQKELRIIEVLEPIMSTHRLICDPACLRPDPENDEHQHVQYQISRITKDRGALKEDGELDALAGCCRAWNFGLRLDPAKAAAKKRQAQLDEQGRRLHALTQSMANAPKNDNFIHRRR